MEQDFTGQFLNLNFIFVFEALARDCLWNAAGNAFFFDVLASFGKQLFDGMPLVILSFVDVVGSNGRQLFDGMPEGIASFPRILGSAGRQLFDGMPLVIPSFVDVVGLEGSFFIECHR